MQRQLSQRSYQLHMVVDVCAGCGLLGLFLALMRPRAKVIALDRRQSVLSRKLSEIATVFWPQLRDRFTWKVCDVRPSGMDTVLGSQSLPSHCLVVACHACGLLTDEVIAASSQSRRPMVLLPCCYVTSPKVGRPNPGHPRHSWERMPWLKEGAVNQEGRTAIDDARVSFLQTQGYEVCMDRIDPRITQYNEAICAFPAR